MNEPRRLISKIIGQLPEPQIRHYRGFPPNITGGKDLREQLGTPVLLLIDNKLSGIFLFRYAQNGEVVGDTWHTSIDEAKEQADSEYGDFISEWVSVPDTVKDAFTYGLKI